jgi:hypothetical protein
MGGSSLSGPSSTMVARTARAPWPEPSTPHGWRRHGAVAVGRGSRFDDAVLVPATNRRDKENGGERKGPTGKFTSSGAGTVARLCLTVAEHSRGPRSSSTGGGFGHRRPGDGEAPASYKSGCAQLGWVGRGEMSEAGGGGGVRGFVEGVGVPVWSWVATWARRSRRACAWSAQASGWKRGGRDWRAGPAGQRHKRASIRRAKAPTRWPHRTTRGREERVGADWRGPLVRERGRADAGTRAQLGLVGRLGRNGFSIFQGFSNCFLSIFSRFSIQIQTKFQIQANSNMCNNSKNI